MTLPFSGKLMTCALCGARERSNINRESGWTMIMLPGSRTEYYICPGCIHGPAKVKGYKLVYNDIFRKLLALEAKKQ